MADPENGHSALVTGGTGYLGSNLVRRLVRQRWSVSVLCRPSSSAKLISDVLGEVKLFRTGASYDEIASAMDSSRPDAVFHIAALYVAEHKPDQIAALVDSNVKFPTLLFDAMRWSGCRKLINCGSLWQQFGNTPNNPANLYAATKEAAEAVLSYYVDAHEFDATTFLIGDVYGPGDPRGKLISALAGSISSGEQLDMTDGHQYIDPIYMEDAVGALIEAGCAPYGGRRHQRWALRSAAPISVRELVAQVGLAAGRPVPIRWNARESRGRQIRVPITCTPRYPASFPWTPLSEGLARTLDLPHEGL